MNTNYGAARPVQIDVTNPAYADYDPIGYMKAHNVEPLSDLEYSPAQARGLVDQVKKAHVRFGRHDATTMVTFTDENLPRSNKDRKVHARVVTSRQR